jgi:WD40 repeat protein
MKKVAFLPVLTGIGLLLAEDLIPRTNANDAPLPPGAIWRQGTPRLLHPGGISALAYAPDGTLLASGGGDGFVRLWNPDNGDEVHAFLGNVHEWRIYSLAFSPDGKTLAAGTGSGIYLWNVAEGKLKRHIEGEALVVAMARTDGNKLAGSGTRVSLWSAGSGKCLGQTPANDRCIYGLTFSPDSKTVIYSHTDAKPGDTDLIFWDIETNKETRRLPGPKRWIHALMFSPDGKTLAAAAHEEVLFWDATSWRRTTTLNTTLRALAYFHDSRRVAVARWHDVQIWNGTTGEKEKTMATQGGYISRVAIAAKGHVLATGDHTGRIRLWDVATGKEKHLQADPIDPAIMVAFSPDGKTLASHTVDFAVRLWDAKTGRAHKVLADDKSLHSDFREGMRTLAFSANGRVLVGGDSRSTVRAWDPGSGKELSRWKTDKYDYALPLDLEPSGKMVAITSSKKTIDLWNVAESKLIRRLEYAGKREDHFDIVLSGPSFSPDGSLVAAVCTPYEPINGGIKIRPVVEIPPPSLHVWETASGKPVMPAGFRNAALHGARQVLWLPDGKMLATIKQQTTVETQPGKYVTCTPVLLWNRGAGHICQELIPEKDGRVTCITISPDGRWLACGCIEHRQQNKTGSREHVICVWETASGKVAWRRPAHRGEIRTLAFSPDGHTLASGSQDATIVMWDLTPPGWQTERLPEAFSAKALDDLWRDLAATDAAIARRAIWNLSARPKQTVPWLAEKLTQDSALPTAQWIADLDHDQFGVREKAKKAIAELGPEALTILAQVDRQKLGLEAQRRVQGLLRELARQPLLAEQLRRVRAVAVLEGTRDRAARQVLTRLSRGRATSPQTEHAQAALERMKSM